jgi:non-specific serine/threonine protein kinase
VPAAPSPLIGRERDCRACAELLLADRSRLLTLVGPPGVGKTRLALALAEQLHDQFEHNVAFVDLAADRDPRLVLPGIAQTFGLRQQGSVSAVEQLQDYLRDMSVLLVLDNFEHLVEASADLAGLLANAPGLVVLATSRAALRIRWERRYEVPPLSPDASLQMFVDRAQAVRPGLAISATEVSIVHDICARLDGLPLAIELAAGRAVLLSPAEILDRLSRRLVVLTDAPRDATSRHRTMRDAIDWSYKLLSPHERALLRRLSVFVGAFSLAAATGVADGSGASLDALTSLVGMSLVRLEPASATPSESRFRLLETVREYASEELFASGEADAAQLDHARWWCGFVETNYLLNFSADQPAYHERLEREHANLRQALTWCIEAGQLDLALRLGGALHWFWYGRGYLAEGLDLLRVALARGVSASVAARAVGARAAGALAMNSGQFDDALRCLDLAITLGRERIPDPLARSELAMALGIRAVTLIGAGHYRAAEASVRESFALFQELDDGWGIATAREVLGAIAALRGDADIAERLAADALVFHREHGSRENIARALDVLGYAAALRQDLSRAEACFEESLVLRRAGINRPAIAAVLARLGLVAYLGRQWQRAAAHYRESLAMAQEVGDSVGVVRCLGQIAALGLAYGLDRRDVARLGSAVQHHQRALHMPSPPVERAATRRLADTLRAETSPVGLATAWLSGRVLALAEAARLGTILLDRILAPAEADSDGTDRPLTPRETQVAVLIAQGLTNRQIAEQLIVAQRTVDTHVERILTKLNFSTRSQVAAWIAAHGMLPLPQDT